MAVTVSTMFIPVLDPDAALVFYRDALGLEDLQEPVSQPWGARDRAVRDPSGNLVRIAQA